MTLKRIAAVLRRARALSRRHRLRLILALRVTVAALSALLLAQAMHLKLPLWAILTSLIVTQLSVGRSLKVATDYLLGTVLGAAYGGALAMLIPHNSEWALLLVLALAIAPLAFIASFKANFNVLPVTAVIVLLVPAMEHVNPAASALDRVLEVAVGGAVGFAVSFLVWPSRAHAITADAADATLEQVAVALAELLKEQADGIDPQRLRRFNEGIGASLARLDAVGTEADHERTARLTSAPDTGPLLRTLLRLRHDIVILGRAMGGLLPETLQQRLAPYRQQISGVATDFLRQSGAALRALRQPPQLDAVESAFKAYADEFAAVRREGLTRGLSSDAAERLFARGFAIEQLREHLAEMQRVVREWAKN
ncbi:MAG: FUSC family protein [Bradyrhizobium sp.]